MAYPSKAEKLIYIFRLYCDHREQFHRARGQEAVLLENLPFKKQLDDWSAYPVTCAECSCPQAHRVGEFREGWLVVRPYGEYSTELLPARNPQVCAYGP